MTGIEHNPKKLTTADRDREFLTAEETAHFLRVQISTVYKMASARRLPFYKPGGKRIYFHIEDVRAWLKSRRISTDEEIAKQAATLLTKSANRRP